MKRILALVCILTVCLTAFSSCKTADSQTANYLKPVKLTESEQQLLTLTHPAEPLLLDYCVEDAVSLSIDTFSLQNGQWVKENQVLALAQDDAAKPMSGRLALNYTAWGDSFGLDTIAVQDTTGSVIRSGELPKENAYEFRASSVSRKETAVVLNEPVCLLLFCADKPETVSNGKIPTDPFYNPEVFTSEYVQIVAITFSDSPLS